MSLFMFALGILSLLSALWAVFFFRKCRRCREVQGNLSMDAAIICEPAENCLNVSNFLCAAANGICPWPWTSSPTITCVGTAAYFLLGWFVVIPCILKYVERKYLSIV